MDAYKRKSTFVTNQEERRNLLLSQQKQKRQNIADANRPLSTNVASSNKPSKRYYPSPFNNQLMLSEWLELIEQDDLEKNWIMCICPVGKRCLVVASEGNTSVYNKGGKLIARHSTKLPGGSRDSKIDETILDCIYNEALRTYFVLDLLQWKLKNHPMTDSETEFRFYWLNCKLDETPELSMTSYENPYKFRNLPRLNECSTYAIQRMFEKPYDFEIDGVLFYHKEAHYHHGHTPLSLWLKAYMIPDILMIPMPEWITDTAPSDYKKEIYNSNFFEIKPKENNANKPVTKYYENSNKMLFDESILNRNKLEINSDNFIEG